MKLNASTITQLKINEIKMGKEEQKEFLSIMKKETSTNIQYFLNEKVYVYFDVYVYKEFSNRFYWQGENIETGELFYIKVPTDFKLRKTPVLRKNLIKTMILLVQAQKTGERLPFNLDVEQLKKITNYLQKSFEIKQDTIKTWVRESEKYLA